MVKFRIGATAAIVGLGLSVGTSAMATTVPAMFDFTDTPPNGVGVALLEIESGGINLDITGGITGEGGGANAPFPNAIFGEVVVSGPLGIGINSSTLIGGEDTSAEGNRGQIDGFGPDEFIQLEFDRTVRLVEFSLGLIGANDSFDFAIDGRDVAVVTTFGTDDATTDAIEVPDTFFFNNPVEEGEPVGTIFTFFTNDLNDDFALTGFVVEEVAPVPLPAALPLMAAGLGFLGFMGRRRKTKS